MAPAKERLLQPLTDSGTFSLSSRAFATNLNGSGLAKIVRQHPIPVGYEMADNGWQIVLPSTSVGGLGSDARLGPLLAVARAANAITISRGPLLVPWEEDGPPVARERFSALFYAAAVLYEALNTSERLEEHFSNLESWKTGFGKLLGDVTVSEFRRRTLKRFRDKGTFHFDEGFFRRAASRWPNEDIVLASLTSSRVEDIYVNAADDLLFVHI